jgi:hypothetical protein
MKKSNMNKKEKSELKKNNLEKSQMGEGLFVFQNRSSQATLQLPKTSFDGKKWIGPNQTWKGDSFFLKMIPREAFLVKTLISPDEQKQKEEERIMAENKLLLDQPDQVTQEGKIEHVVETGDVVELNEGSTKKKKKKNENVNNPNTLLTEDPIAGVTIIRD